MDSRSPAASRSAARRKFWSGSNRIRLLLTMELAVMLPAAALIYANFHQLKSIERDKALEAAIHRDFQQMLAISEKQLNMKAYTMAEEVRNLFPSPDAEKTETLAAFDHILAKHSWLSHLFLFDSEKGFVIRSQPSLADDPYAVREEQRMAKLFTGWFAFEGKALTEMLHKRTRPISWYTERTKRGGRYVWGTSGMFLLPHVAKDRIVLGGMAIDPSYLQQKFFPQMLEGLIAYKRGEEGGNKLAMIVYPVDAAGEGGWSAPAAAEEALATSEGWTDGPPEVVRNLDDVFRGLALGIKFEGTSVEALGRRWVRGSLVILAVLSVLLAGGLALNYRSVSKELELARLKSDFVSNVSHELRTPLSLIRLYAETLELGRITKREKIQEYYRIIRAESERLTALINNILDFSRIEAGRKEYDFRNTDLGDLVAKTLDTYRDQIQQQGFTFAQSIEPGIPPMRVDQEAIARSLVNLVNNALKYSADEKFLGVKLYRDNGVVKLEVADRGIGIARGEQAKIFEKFYRAGDPLVHNTKGSGLGLSLVRHIAHAHGGEVVVESTPGKGSTFTLSLPLAQAAPEPSADAATV